MPVREITTMTPSLARITGQSRTRWFHANGNTMRNANDQRRKESVTGGIGPAARRPTMALPAQQSAVTLSSRWGWLAIRRTGEAAREVWSEADIYRGPD